MKFTTVFFVLSCAASAATAQDGQELINRFAPDGSLSWLLQAPRAYQSAMQDKIRRIGGSDGVLSAEDIAAKRQDRVNWRIDDRQRLASAFDRDNDGFIHRWEAEEAVLDRVGTEGRYQQILQDADADGDEVLSPTEISEYAINYAEAYRELDAESGADLLIHDLDGDGDVSVREVEEFVARATTFVFQTDACILPTVPIDEPPAVWTHILRAAKEAGAPNADGQVVVELFLNDFGQDEEFITVLALSQEPVLWSVLDAGSRLDLLVITDTAHGVEGIDPDRVIVVPQTACTQAFERGTRDWIVSRSQIKRQWGPYLYDNKPLAAGKVRMQF
ncbi:MAG: hypothetical protein AAFX07_15930 [Pseudomonadota bacterium]